MEKSLLRILATNLPENSIRPLIDATERLESFFQEKPHSFCDQPSKHNLTNEITRIEGRRDRDNKRKNRMNRDSSAPETIHHPATRFSSSNFPGRILYPLAWFLNRHTSSSLDPSSRRPLSGNPFYGESTEKTKKTKEVGRIKKGKKKR